MGGRYSIWSDISLSAFYELTKIGQNSFFKGGYQADLDLKKNEEYLKFIKTLVYSDIWLHNFKNKTSRAVLSYSWKLRSFPDYVQQLEMESLGKPASKESEFKKTGQIIFGGYGPTAQHSYFQLLHQGTQEICADFIASKEDPKSLPYAQAITQARLLSNGADDLSYEKERINGNVPVNLFLLNKVDPFTLGYLIATWEHRTYITAAMLKINPFDQFGVSAGKTYTKRYLSKKD
jgi:glucose-6-phosphate isomerase